MGSVLKKRRKKMNKHKYRKLRKRMRFQRLHG
ncbi:MAG: aurora kinase A-interacting protein [Planctomycetota bacterium]